MPREGHGLHHRGEEVSISRCGSVPTTPMQAGDPFGCIARGKKAVGGHRAPKRGIIVGIRLYM